MSNSGDRPNKETMTPDLIPDTSGVLRCWWCGTDPLYINYHDREWGRPVYDDHRLFEKICLEGFQAGLSWITILRKREAFRQAFRNFDLPAVASFTQRDVKGLLENEKIVRHQGKIESTINNAQRAIETIEQYGSLAKYFWRFQPQPRPALRSRRELVSQTPESKSLSKELKKRGWTFVGPTTCYAFMQAMGMVNDHLEGCHIWQEVEDARR